MASLSVGWWGQLGSFGCGMASLREGGWIKREAERGIGRDGMEGDGKRRAEGRRQTLTGLAVEDGCEGVDPFVLLDGRDVCPLGAVGEGCWLGRGHWMRELGWWLDVQGTGWFVSERKEEGVSHEHWTRKSNPGTHLRHTIKPEQNNCGGSQLIKG